jgi:hypothetical protein
LDNQWFWFNKHAFGFPRNFYESLEAALLPNLGGTRHPFLTVPYAGRGRQQHWANIPHNDDVTINQLRGRVLSAGRGLQVAILRRCQRREDFGFRLLSGASALQL